MSRDFINIIGWILFTISAIGFTIASVGLDCSSANAGMTIMERKNIIGIL